MWGKISVLRRSTGKAIWVIIDIRIREQEKRRKTREERGSSPAHLGHYTSVWSSQAKRRMKRGASYTWLSENEPFDERVWRAEKGACACAPGWPPGLHRHYFVLNMF